MPPQPSYPGVHISEIPSGVRPISGVSTSVTAFLGRTWKGPVNDPIEIFNRGDFRRVFGGLWKGSPLAHAVWDFFANGGRHALIVRLFRETANPGVS